jgi:hypothetical protein
MRMYSFCELPILLQVHSAHVHRKRHSRWKQRRHAYWSVYTNVIFSVGCDSHIRHRTKDRKNPIFCAVLDAAVASDTENHCLCKQTIKAYSHTGKVRFLLQDAAPRMPYDKSRISSNFAVGTFNVARQNQGCQMVYLQTQNRQFCGPWNVKNWNILWQLGIFVALWYILDYLVFSPLFGILYQGKSGNPGQHATLKDSIHTSYKIMRGLTARTLIPCTYANRPLFLRKTKFFCRNRNGRRRSG